MSMCPELPLPELGTCLLGAEGSQLLSPGVYPGCGCSHADPNLATARDCLKLCQDFLPSSPACNVPPLPRPGNVTSLLLPRECVCSYGDQSSWLAWGWDSGDMGPSVP